MGKVKWRWEYGVYGCFCPYCNEWAYEKDHCVFCGKSYEWVEPKHKDTIIEQGEYTIVQATNNHISIYKNGWFVFHAQYKKKLTEEELKKYLDDYIRELPKLIEMAKQIESEEQNGITE